MAEDLDEVIANEPVEEVDLTVIRKKAAELRDEYLHKADLENQLKECSNRIARIERDDLIDMFSKARVSRVDVEAEGNHPAFVVERNTVIAANIPEDKRADALQWFEDNGHGDLVKSVINIVFGMQEHDRRLAVMKLLADNDVPYYTNESVHHMTLKAFVKREIKAGRIIPLDLLGVYIHDEVKIK